jgi:uncharacterized repeat protein (TIGR02543 family)
MPSGGTYTGSYQVTYNANGGSVSPTSAWADAGASVTLPIPTRSGYTFNGWYTAASGGTKVGNADASYTPTGNITLYAHWTTEGVFIGIISFAGDASDLTGGAPILLDASGKETLIRYLNSDYTIASQSGTALFYAVHKALANLKSNEAHYPENLDSVNMITFTDGLDNGSFMASNTAPIEGQSELASDAYLTYVQGQIASRQIAGKPVTAFSAGIRGNDVSDTAKFESNLAGIASPDNSSNLTNFSELQTKFEAIANGLNTITNTGTTFTVVTPGLSPGEIVRMAFDVTGDSPTAAAASTKYIQGTIGYSGGTYSLGNITYAGGLGSSEAAGPVSGTMNGTEVNFVFTNISGYEDAERYLVKQWIKSSEASPWQINSEYEVGSGIDITVERRSAIIYLVLDASTSLDTTQIGQIREASIAFIDSLYGRSAAPAAPAAPGLTVEDGILTVSWNSVSYADSYKVYYSASSTAPSSPAQSGVTGTTTTIPGLSNDTQYYVWVQATNSGGDSALSQAALTWTSCFYEADSAETFARAISSISARGSGTHTITVTGDFTSSSVAFSGGKNQIITIKGDSTARVIANGGNSAFLTVPSGTTLILDNNITLDGNAKAYSVVSVSGDGTLRMNNGATISNAKASGVQVTGTNVSGTYVGGTFIMSGGTISGNTDTTSYSSGGGVCVYYMPGGGGTFRKSGGGTIDDTNSAPAGKVVSFVNGSNKRRNTAVGPNDDLDSAKDGSAGGWE